MCNHQKLVNTLGCCTLSSPGHQYKYSYKHSDVMMLKDNSYNNFIVKMDCQLSFF